jgi:hypothetical protein
VANGAAALRYELVENFGTSEVGEYARPGRCWPRLAASFLRVKLTQTLGSFQCARVFREGAKNCARGGRAPFSIWEFGLNKKPSRYEPGGHLEIQHYFFIR